MIVTGLKWITDNVLSISLVFLLVINSIARFWGIFSFLFFNTFVTCSGISLGSLYLYFCLLCSSALLSAYNGSMPNTNLECAYKESVVSKLQLSDAMADLVSFRSPSELH